MHAEKSIQLRNQVNEGTKSLEDVTSFIEQGYGTERMEQIRILLNSYEDLEENLVSIRSDEADAVADQATRLATLGAGFAIGIALITNYLITKAITGPIKKAGELAESITRGNLNNDIVVQQTESGNSVVSKAVAAMRDIDTSSKKIADIILVTDEIAFQTNRLALNTAVEAARWRTGKGFCSSRIRSTQPGSTQCRIRQ